MKREKLIEELQKLTPGVEVCIFDNRKNIANDFGDGSSSGIYSEFEVVMLKKKDIPNKTKPFAILNFDNDDYDEDGRLDI